MRKQFVKSMKEILYGDIDSVLLLGDIGVFGFRDELKNIPNRAYNIGILEQATVSLAAGMARGGMIPFIHTIAPFMVERALEQIKVDFGYQELNGNFVIRLRWSWMHTSLPWRYSKSFEYTQYQYFCSRNIS
jgi:transketolase